LLNKLNLSPEDELVLFIGTLNQAGIATRYPENLKRSIEAYPPSRTQEIISKTKEVIEWIKRQ